MKRYVFLIAMTMCCIASFGQQRNNTLDSLNNEVKELTQKVSSLDHELKFLSLSYDLYRINTDLTLFSEEIRITGNEVKNLIYRDYYKYDIYKSYKDNYDVSMKKLNVFEELIKSAQYKYDAFCTTYSLYEVELNNFKGSWGYIKAGYVYLQKTLEMYKIYLDTYEEAL